MLKTIIIGHAAEPYGHGSQSGTSGASTNTDERHKDYLAFEKYVNSDNTGLVHPLLFKSRTD